VSDFEIRAARAEEFATIGEITVEAYTAGGFLGENAEPAYADKLRDAASRAEHAELVAAVDADGTVLGTVTVVHPGTRYSEVSREGELEFRMIAVRPSATGRGVGAALTGAVLDRARELNAQRVVLCSLDIMTTAHRMYERVGFTRLPDRDWSPAPGVNLVAYTHPV
jgi:predicted N-acetyltransferase YhbS